MIDKSKLGLMAFDKEHDYLIAMDSDGCAIDSMEVKHRECFTPQIIKFWQLEGVTDLVMETALFINLYSKTRGLNRFSALLRLFQELEMRPEFVASKCTLGDYRDLKFWVETSPQLSVPSLQKAWQVSGSEVLKKAMDWSCAVNAAIAQLPDANAFPGVLEMLQEAAPHADMLVVSSANYEAIEAEWSKNSLSPYLKAMAGQEVGTKSFVLKHAMAKGYAPMMTLMIGDAPGDYKAAVENHALFFPILPGHEKESWQKLRAEGLQRFWQGDYEGTYQNELLAIFQASMPESPGWKRISAAPERPA